MLVTSIVFSILFIAGHPVFAATNVNYLDQNGAPQTATSTTDVTASMATTWTSGWYSVTDPSTGAGTTVTISGRIVVSGNVNLILPDNSTLNAQGGVTVPPGSSFSVYAQSFGSGNSAGANTGTLNACWAGTVDGSGNPTNLTTTPNMAGIGGDGTGGGANATPGTITINGGYINAASGDMSAGIGGASNSAPIVGNGGTININGGTVRTFGVGWHGSGIGGGGNGDGGNITITGGTVSATGGGYGSAGIGGGGSYYPPSGMAGSGGTIIITGGNITAVGNSSAYGGAAGIGGAGGNGADLPGNSGNISITGNTVITATGGNYNYDGTNGYWGGGGGAAIGSGGSDTSNQGQVGNIYIDSGTVTLNLTGGTGYSQKGRTNGAQVGYGGYAPPSTGANLITNIIPTAPQSLTASGEQLYQITLNWTPPVSTGLPVSGYYVQWSTDGSTWTTPVNAGNVLTYDVTGLTYETEYYFQVAAFNTANNTTTGYNWAQVIDSTLPPGAPTAPQNVAAAAGNGQATVSFSPPASDNGSVVTGYTVSASDGTSTLTASGTDSPITITGLTNGTAYSITVTATNIFGTSAASSPAVSVTPYTVPSAPRNLTAAAGNGQVALSWTAPSSNGGSAIASYEYSTDGGSTWNPITGSGASTTNYTITGLINGTTYNLAVRAVNAAGAGASAMTAAVPCTTASAPQSFASVAGDGQISLTWTAPATNGGSAITSYRISTDGGSTWNPITGSGASTTSYTVTGLTNGTAYNIQVSAVNAAGAGTPATLTATPVAAPSQPQSLTATTGSMVVTLAWTAPASDGGSAIAYYQYSSDGGNTWTTIPGSDATTTSYPVEGLVNGTSYSFGIRAVNSAGLTGAAATVQATPSTTPNEPMNLAATAGDSTILMTWAAPVDNGGSEITEYIVNATPGDGGAVISIPTAADVFTLTLNGLTNGVTYSIYVDAVNDNGLSPDSVVVSATPSATPSPPQNLVATAGNGQISLSWAAPATDGGGAIISYQYSINDISTWTTIPGSNASTTSYVINGLTNGSAYTVSVQAVNAAGAGAYAAPDSVTPCTTPSAPTIFGIMPSAGQVQIAFTPPSSNGGSAITGYTVTVSPANSSGVSTFTGTSSPISIPGLSSGTVYSFTVTAQNAAGTSPSAMTSGSPANAPTAPQNVTVSENNGQATVSFFQPSSDGGLPVTSYTVTISPANSSGVSTFTSATSPITFSGLTGGTTYSIQVAATNVIGTGALSAATQITASVPLQLGSGTPVLAPATINVSYNQTLSSTGYPAPTSWIVTAGSLPPGLSLDPATGALTGTPTARGNYAFTITASNISATNPSGSSASKAFTMNVGAPTYPYNTDIIKDFGTWTGTGEAMALVSFDAVDFIDLKYANGGALVRAQDYYIISGSTEIFFTTAYLNTLRNGTYYYIAEYTDYDTHRIRLVINRSGGSIRNYDPDNDGDSDSPATGDDPYTLFLMTWLTIVSALCLLMLFFYYRMSYGSSRSRK